MNLYQASSFLSIQKNKLYLIQNIEGWYRHVDLAGIYRTIRIPSTHYQGVTEHILAEELHQVFCLPVVIDWPNDGGFGEMAHSAVQNHTDGLLNQYTRDLLKTPKERNTSEIHMWLRGMDLYMAYCFED